MPKRKKQRTHSKRTASKKSMSAWGKWTAEREQFYSDHPNARALLGLLVVVFVAFLALVYVGNY